MFLIYISLKYFIPILTIEQKTKWPSVLQNSHKHIIEGSATAVDPSIVPNEKGHCSTFTVGLQGYSNGIEYDIVYGSLPSETYFNDLWQYYFNIWKSFIILTEK